MLIFTPQSLAFIAVPKTGTTAVEMALKSKADILFAKRFKHMTAHRFHKKVAPFLEQSFGLRPDRFAMMRDPEEQIRSWFRYRTRDKISGSEISTDGVSFDAFVQAVISQDPPRFAGIGSQYNMLVSGDGDVLVHHLFAYEKPLQFRSFLSDRFGEEIKLKPRNVSPPIDAPLSPQTRAKLRDARAAEFDLYARLQDAGGHLKTQLD